MWQVDVAINTAKAALPFRATLRRLIRARRGYPITTNAPLALGQGLQQIDDLRHLGIAIEGRSVLDLGSGWHPIVPLLYRVAGAASIHLTDMERLMDAETLTAAVAWLSRQAAQIASRLGVSPETVRARLQPGSGPLEPMLSSLGMIYHVPFSSAATPTVDLIVSRVVLEHIPPETLLRMHRDFARALHPGGTAAHVVDNSDHRQHRDGRLSRIDFLRYRARNWRLLCLNSQDYCNRLRHPDHVRLLRAAGFDVLLDRGKPDEQALRDARSLRLAAPWRSMPKEELAILTSHLVARVDGRRVERCRRVEAHMASSADAWPGPSHPPS